MSLFIPPKEDRQTIHRSHDVITFYYYRNDRLDHPAPSQIPLILSWELPIMPYYYRNDRPDRPLRRFWGLGARSAHLSAEGARRRQAACLREAGGRLLALLAFASIGPRGPAQRRAYRAEGPGREAAVVLFQARSADLRLRRTT